MSDTVPSSSADQYESGSPTIELLPSARHELLADRRRRQAVDILDGRVASLDLDTVAEAIAAREEADPAPETIERVAIELHHNHLPKLDECGFIEYEPKARLVHATGTRLVSGCEADADRC